MQSEIIAKIDSLLKISEPQANYETLKVELREIECSIEKSKSEIKELKDSMNDDKYFDASAEIVDKNIEISLTKKIKSIKKSLEELDNQLEKQTLIEQNQFEKIAKLKEEITSQKSFIEIIKERKHTDSQKEIFQTLLKENEQKLKNVEKELAKLTKEYEKIQSKLEVLSFSKKELKNKIDDETEKLLDVKANLLNKRGYINNELKKEDQEAIEELEKKLQNLENEKSQILANPIIIAEDAKNYLIDDDKTACLKKAKELKDIILSIPYMNIKGINANEDLKIELENAEAKRDEFSSMINSKNYESVDTTLIKDRLAYINDKKNSIEKEINEITEKINSNDSSKLEDLNNRINYCENEVKTLKERIDEFEKNFANEELTLTKKSALQAALDKKKEELDNINCLLESYRKDREKLIISSFNLEKNYINNLNQDIVNIDEEIKKLEKILMTASNSKNTIEVENDKNKLKELNENIKAIKKRQNLKKSPEEIYEEIEIILGTEIDDIAKDKNDNEKEKTIELSIKKDDDTVEKEKNNNLIEESVLTENKVIEPLDLNEKVLEEEKIDSLPVIDDEELALNITELNNNEEKLKVINVETLEENKNEEASANNEFLIGDYVS